MLSKLKVCVVEGTFDNLYHGGKDRDTAEKIIAWDEYWTEKRGEKPYGVQFVPSQDRSDCWRIVGTNYTIYLHPMGFNSCGVFGPKGNNDDMNCVLDEIKKLCEEVAKKCGGHFKMKAQVFDLTTDNMREW